MITSVYKTLSDTVEPSRYSTPKEKEYFEFFYIHKKLILRKRDKSERKV